MTDLQARVKPLLPGLAISAVVAVAAMFLAEHYGAPVMLFALLLGMALNFLTQEEGGQATRSAAGIDFVARQVLRLGVALLGLRITADQVLSLGWQPVAMVVLAVALTIGVGIVLARLMGFQMFFGLLTGGAVAICGASAALALSAAMPQHPRKGQATLFTVIGVSTLSTLAMVLYPMVTNALGMDAVAAGYFIGGTIHDVAQVVGAGYSLSHEAGDAATLVKLIRVAMLLPVIALAALLTRRQMLANGEAMSGPRPPLLPWFAVAFALLVVVNSTGWLPAALVGAGKSASQWCLIASMAAIGMKTHLKDILTVGWKPVALMVLETVFLAALFYGLLQTLD
ncbi:putative sulfate exporter family transporter [Hydrogenophaga sp. D2P1]|uniref:Putative sulfate exporter family transporter n=1 Tax=Hydrogenophaga aromaticivorans TaxID=2610898 RepID=A0A7Y8GVE5_9BURK|nr:putative sulfate exporter family transporter [Hydrogenophaga aromaticivorans]NWF45575.1 putative sulfate exporter family transporter [Hydrogenophaga aromaticivorans]